MPDDDLEATSAPERWSPVAADHYRRVLGRFASGVTVCTTRAAGVDHAMTATAFTSVSLHPPLVLVCVERRARFHDAVLSAGFWAVSVLGVAAVPVATRFAKRGRPLAGQFDGVPTRRGVTGAPLLSEAIAWLECRTTAVHDGGDHVIVVGEVVAASAAAEGVPLVHFTGGYHTVTDQLDGRGPTASADSAAPLPPPVPATPDERACLCRG